MVGNENWLPVVGFEGHYEVSNLGRVYSLKRRKILKPRLLRRYWSVYLRDKDRVSNRHIHRIVALAFLGPALGRQTRHLDGNNFNNAVENLMWGTAKENASDRHLHGTTVKGEQHYRAKFSESDVARIRLLHYQGLGPSAIGRIVGIHKARVHEITSRKT